MNNRIIKFRVWDTILKKFIIYNSFLSFDDKQYIFQQFTGLTDKNGKKVYGGDIIGGESEMVYLMSGYKTGEKKFIKKEIYWSDKHNGWAARKIGRETAAISGINIALQYYNVIGNIFENPELLK